MDRVRTNATYVYDPVGLDRCDKPYGALHGILSPGDVVRVVTLPGCPPPNTMRMCHIHTLADEFAGLVCVSSLQQKAVL